MVNSAARSLHRLQLLRVVEIAGQLIALLVAVRVLQLALPLTPFISVVGALVVLTLLTGWRLKQPWPVAQVELFVQLLVDVAALTILLYFTGGSTNPFVSLFLLPLSIAAALLSAGYVWAMAGITLACYTLLMYFYIPLPGTEHAAPMTTLFAQGADMQHAEMHIHGAEQGSFSMHVVGMWLNFMFSAAVIAFFVQRIAASLRERERELAAAREETLRNERIVALGTLAAGTAHELGTPLATVAVVAKDLQEEYANDPELGPQLGLIRGQIDLCKGVLSKIVAASGQLQAGETRNVPLDRAVSELMEQWGLLRPGVRAKVGRVAAESAILRVDGTLEQALLNLLNNAADASPSGLELETAVVDGQAVLRILDRGTGLSTEMLDRAGRLFFSAKPAGGMGIGLVLANATIERFGGSVRLSNREGGGACTEITLPLVADAA